MLAPVLALLLAAAPGPERVEDPSAGYAASVPRGWTAELVSQSVLSLKGTGGQRALLLAMRAGDWPANDLATALARKLEGVIVQESPIANGHGLLLDLGGREAQRGLLLVAVSGERGLVALLTAPAKSFARQRAELIEVARSLAVLASEEKGAPTAAIRPLVFVPFHEPSEGAFSAELPEGWERELSCGVVQEPQPYAKAAAVLRSPDHAFAFAHYKLASFREPASAAERSPEIRSYIPGGEVLEKVFFRAQARSEKQLGEWSILWRGGAQELFAHPSGVRFDGEEIEYAYRLKGERLLGRAYAITYRTPEEKAAPWLLYGLFGWEAPAAQLESARRAGLELLETWRFEKRFAPQSDLFWALARESALGALAVERRHAGLGFAKREQAQDALEAALLGLEEASAAGHAEPPKLGPAQLLAAPAGAGEALGFPASVPLR